MLFVKHDELLNLCPNFNHIKILKYDLKPTLKSNFPPHLEVPPPMIETGRWLWCCSVGKVLFAWLLSLGRLFPWPPWRCSADDEVLLWSTEPWPWCAENKEIQIALMVSFKVFCWNKNVYLVPVGFSEGSLWQYSSWSTLKLSTVLWKEKNPPKRTQLLSSLCKSIVPWVGAGFDDALEALRDISTAAGT